MSRRRSRGTPEAHRSKHSGEPSGNGRLFYRKPIRPYIDPPEVVTDGRPDARHKALTETAQGLLAELWRRYAFAYACEMGTPVDWAGDRILGVRRQRAYQIRKESATIDDVHAWFVAAVMDAMRRGKIARGRDTAKSDVADAFFTALAGGKEYLRDLRVGFGAQSHARLEEINEGLEDHWREVNDYLVHSHLVWRMMKEEGK
jgi:hypothetical protein